MSIIERSNPLNLQYRIAVVTNASSPLGVVVCKTLLKANANVLGVDSGQKDPSLNAGLGTHFQYEQADVHAEETPHRVVEAAIEKYGLTRLDILINIVLDGKESDLGGLERIGEAVCPVMETDKRGTVITLHADVNVKEEQLTPLAEYTKAFAKKYQNSGIRCNVVVPEGSTSADRSSAKAYEDAKVHMKDIIKGEKSANNKPADSKFYEVGNLVLFLASDLGETIAGSQVYTDGSSRQL